MADVTETYRIVGENAVGAAFRQILSQSKSTADRMAASFRQAFGAISAISIGRTLLTWNRQAIENADTLGTLAEAFGTTVEEMSRFDYAARQTNTNLEQLVPGLTAFQKNLVLAGEDAGRARKALAELNLDANKLARLPLPRQLEEVADRFRKVENPAERVRIAAQLFGDEVGRRLIPLLARGREGIRALGEEADRTGATLTKEMAAKLQAMDAELKRVEAQAMLLKRELALGLGPAVLEIGKIFNTTAKGALNFGEALAEMLHGADTPIGQLRVRLDELIDRRNELLNWQREAEKHGAEASLLAKWSAELVDVERELNRVNSALLQLGRDAQAYEPLKSLEEGAQRARRELESLAVTASKIQLTPMEQLYQDMEQATRTSIERQTAEWNQFKVQLDELLAQGLISVETYNARLEEFLDKTIPEVEVTAQKVNENIKQIDHLSVYAEQAARNMQDAFADFLFDPFDKGIKGMLREFINVIRRMVAEIAAAQLLQGLGLSGSGGGFLGSLFGGLSGLGSNSALSQVAGTAFGGQFAGGGKLRPGEWGIVGEKGPEIAVGGTSGQTILPMDKVRAQRSVSVSAPVQFNIRVDGSTDRSITQAQIENAVRTGLSGYHEFWRDQLSRGAFA